MVDQPIQATPVPEQEPRQGCLKIGTLTAARLLVHFVVLLVVFSVLVTPVQLFIRFFEQENLKLPAITVLIVNMSYRMNGHFFVIIPVLLAVDACMLILLQLPPRPWRFLARIWFSSVLLGAFLLMAVTVFSMAVPIESLLPPEARVLAPDGPLEPIADENPR